MINVKTFSNAQLKKTPKRILAEALAKGRVRILDEKGRAFLLRPEGISPLDVPAVRVGLTAEEIVQLVRDEREGKPISVKSRKPKRIVKSRRGAA